ncbi:MAG: hypothetical protein NT025_10450, partial [bacterium]|nr:hypothetical protein [bacterium]
MNLHRRRQLIEIVRQQFHDGTDREHGARAADYALELNREVLLLDRPGLELLTYAVRYHSDGLLEAD